MASSCPTSRRGSTRIRDILRAGVAPPVVRLYDETDTAVVFGGQGLEVPEGCLLITGCEGRQDVAEFTEQVASSVLAEARRPRTSAASRARTGARTATTCPTASPSTSSPAAPSATRVTLDTMEVAGTWADLPRDLRRRPRRPQRARRPRPRPRLARLPVRCLHLLHARRRQRRRRGRRHWRATTPRGTRASARCWPLAAPARTTMASGCCALRTCGGTRRRGLRRARSGSRTRWIRTDSRTPASSACRRGHA